MKYLPRLTAMSVTAACLALLAPSRAQAFSLYCELGAGASYILNASGYFTGSSAAYPMSIGPAANLNLMADALDDRSVVDFHFGFINKIVSGRDALGKYYGYYAPTFALRLQIWRIFFGGGASYWSFQRDSQTNFWVDGFNYSTPGLGISAEVGFLFPISPNASFGLQATGQWMPVNGTIGPIPALDLTGFFRFYFWYPTSAKSASGVSGGSHSSREWKGWRYPYGEQK